MSKSYFFNLFKLSLTMLLCMCILSRNSFAEIAIIVHPNNPIDSLTETQVKKIFLGQSRLFPNTKIGMKVFDIESDHWMYSKFYEQFVGYPVYKLQRYRAAYLFSGKGVVPEAAPSFLAIKNQVSSKENAIGYIDAQLVDHTVQVVYLWSETQEKKQIH